MKRLAIVALPVLVLSGCGGSPTTLAQCVDSWNANSSEKRSLTQADVSVRVAHFDGGECALVTNSGGAIGGLVEREGHWQSYPGQPQNPSDALAVAREMQRLAPVLSTAGNQEPNVTIDAAGNVRPMAGAEIGVLGVDL